MIPTPETSCNTSIQHTVHSIIHYTDKQLQYLFCIKLREVFPPEGSNKQSFVRMSSLKLLPNVSQ